MSHTKQPLSMQLLWVRAKSTEANIFSKARTSYTRRTKQVQTYRNAFCLMPIDSQRGRAVTKLVPSCAVLLHSLCSLHPSFGSCRCRLLGRGAVSARIPRVWVVLAGLAASGEAKMPGHAEVKDLPWRASVGHRNHDTPPARRPPCQRLLRLVVGGHLALGECGHCEDDPRELLAAGAELLDV
eukprot:2078676-Pleurochrysis_carterae.AAC.4